MKLRNRYTGEVKDWDFGNWYQTILNPDNKESYECTLTDFMDRVAKFREDWEDYEDYEEQEEYYLIDVCGEVEATDRGPDDELAKQMQSIGNYFKTKEEAEKAIEKLKAFKRLKDKGFKFDGWGLLEYAGCDSFSYSPQIGFSIPTLDKDEPYAYPEEIERDLDLLFGGEE